jgi:hypothetical protein
VPIYMEISRLHRTVTIVARGKIAPDEVRGMAQQLAEAHVRPLAKVVDVTAATAELTPEHIARVAELLRGDGREKRGPVAFIVDASRGAFARAFAQQTEGEGPISVFRSLHEARAWLERIQRAPAADVRASAANEDHSPWSDPHRRGLLLRGGRQRAVTARSLISA